MLPMPMLVLQQQGNKGSIFTPILGVKNGNKEGQIMEQRDISPF